MADTPKRVGLDLTQGNIFRQLMIFVLPLLLANIVQQLYNTVCLLYTSRGCRSRASSIWAPTRILRR